MPDVPECDVDGLREEHIDGVAWWTFTWSGPGWETALIRLKRWVPLEYRRWDPNTKRWGVRVDWEPAEMTLAGCFSGWRGALTALRSQLAMF